MLQKQLRAVGSRWNGHGWKANGRAGRGLQCPAGRTRPQWSACRSHGSRGDKRFRVVPGYTRGGGRDPRPAARPLESGVLPRATVTGISSTYPLWDLMEQRGSAGICSGGKRMAGKSARPRPWPRLATIPHCTWTICTWRTRTPAAEWIADGGARAGLAQGHHAFKIKVGRGRGTWRWKPGQRHDIAVVRAVHAGA